MAVKANNCRQQHFANLKEMWAFRSLETHEKTHS